MAYAERRDSVKGPRYRGFYKGTDGRYRSAVTYDIEQRALDVSRAAERHAAELTGGSAGGLDPVTRATRTIEQYAPVFLRHHRVEGNTKDTYEGTLRLHVIPFIGKARLAEISRVAARGFFTALEEAGRSPNTIRQAKVALAAMFTMAVSAGWASPVPPRVAWFSDRTASAAARARARVASEELPVAGSRTPPVPVMSAAQRREAIPRQAGLPKRGQRPWPPWPR